MLEVTASRDLLTGKAFVWGIITDFQSYHVWHPFATISGTAMKGEKVEYSLNVVSQKFGDHAIAARVTSVDAFNQICWTYGLFRVFFVEEWFSTTTVPGGTRVVHGMRFKGPLASLFKRRLTRQVGPMLEASVEALARHATAPGTAGKLRRSPSYRLGRKRRRSNTSGF